MMKPLTKVRLHEVKIGKPPRLVYRAAWWGFRDGARRRFTETVGPVSTTRRKDGPHVFRMGWCADYPDANNWLMEVFHPTKSVNRVHWSNEEFARLTERAQIARDPAERIKLYRRAEQILSEEEAVIAPVYFYTSVALTKPYLKRSVAPLGGNHIRDWSFTD